jgi:sporulation protein YlmC with PRC-barrel domain
MITRRIAVSSLCAGAVTVGSGAVRGDDVRYVGGTIVEIPQDTEGSLLINPNKGLMFECKKGNFEIPFDRVTSLEYGQKAGRRLGVAIMVNPVFLLSKKRKHYVTIGYKDAKDVSQGVVLELAKGLPAKVITIVEARSGVKCDYESEEARKHLHG